MVEFKRQEPGGYGFEVSRTGASRSQLISKRPFANSLEELRPSFCRRRRRELPLHDPDDHGLQLDLRQVDPAGFGPILERADFHVEGLDAFGQRLAVRSEK